MKQINIQFQKYFKGKYRKTQIYLHHTVSPNKLHNRGVSGDIRYWNNQKYNIGTYCIINSDGIVYKLFEPYYWSNHLGLKKSTFQKYNIPYYKLDKTSIGIELDNLGPLIWTKKGFTSYAYQNSFYVPKERVIDYGQIGFRGHRYYEAYTKEQIESLKIVLSSLAEEFVIPKHYNKDMWDISLDALKGVPGIYTHTSVRSDKSDCHPQPELIQMLKNLKPKPNYNPPKPIVFTEKYLQYKQFINNLSNLGWGQNLIK